MALADVDVPGSDAWWMQKAWQELRASRDHLTLLENYRRGTPPLKMGTTKTEQRFYDFQQMARFNVCDLAVQALVERLGVRTMRTTAGSDDDGDVYATRMLAAMGGELDDVFRMLATFGRAYTSSSEPDVEGGLAVIHAEDPRECVVLCDARGRAQAGFKLFYDPLTGYDYAILWRPGRKVVAWNPKGTKPQQEQRDRALREPRISFTPSKFTIRPVAADSPDEDAGDPSTPLFSETYSVQDIPLVEHRAPEGVGVYERHLNTVDEINHVILQGLVIATLQAFKQRAIELTVPLPEEDPKTGLPIDYNDVFAADPGALWELPSGAKIWESGEVNLQNVLQQAKDVVQRFASVTRTPFSMFMPDVAQSAEGAQNTREGIVFKAEAMHRVETLPLCTAVSIGFRFMADEIRYSGDGADRVDRADIIGMSIDWSPAERYSLAEMANADSQSTLPQREKYARIYSMTPAEVDVAMGHLEEDALRAATAKVSSAGDGTAATAA